MLNYLQMSQLFDGMQRAVVHDSVLQRQIEFFFFVVAAVPASQRMEHLHTKPQDALIP